MATDKKPTSVSLIADTRFRVNDFLKYDFLDMSGIVNPACYHDIGTLNFGKDYGIQVNDPPDIYGDGEIFICQTPDDVDTIFPDPSPSVNDTVVYPSRGNSFIKDTLSGLTGTGGYKWWGRSMLVRDCTNTGPNDQAFLNIRTPSYVNQDYTVCKYYPGQKAILANTPAGPSAITGSCVPNPGPPPGPVPKLLWNYSTPLPDTNYPVSDPTLQMDLGSKTHHFAVLDISVNGDFVAGGESTKGIPVPTKSTWPVLDLADGDNVSVTVTWYGLKYKYPEIVTVATTNANYLKNAYYVSHPDYSIDPVTGQQLINVYNGQPIGNGNWNGGHWFRFDDGTSNPYAQFSIVSDANVPVAGGYYTQWGTAGSDWPLFFDLSNGYGGISAYPITMVFQDQFWSDPTYHRTNFLGSGSIYVKMAGGYFQDPDIQGNGASQHGQNFPVIPEDWPTGVLMVEISYDNGASWQPWASDIWATTGVNPSPPVSGGYPPTADDPYLNQIQINFTAVAGQRYAINATYY